MKTLFAPWRMEFIEGPEPISGCVLCDIAQNSDDPAFHVLEKRKHAYVVMNKYPYSHGHLMVVPCRHEASWAQLSQEEGAEIFELTQRALVTLGKALNAQGYNMGMNLGRVAGAGIEAHVHQHIVPRWSGDFNFMPLLAETKMISEHLDATYAKLKEMWGKS
jgi:ATP adenylyltransferase